MRAFLDGDTDVLAGKLRELAQLPHPATRDRSVEVRELRVDELRETQATATLDATVRFDRVAVRYDGPVVLERRDGVWRVLDYVRDGERALDHVHVPLRTTQRAGAVELAVVAMRRLGPSDLVVATLRNGSDEPVRVRRVFGRGGRRWRAGSVEPGVVVEPAGERTFWLAVWPTDEDEPRLAVEARTARGRAWFDLRPRLDGGAEEQPPPRKRPRGLRPVPPLVSVLALLVGPIALLAVLGPQSWIPGLLLAYAAGFGWVALQIARRAGRRAARIAGALAAATLAAAGLAWGIEHALAAHACTQAKAVRAADAYARSRGWDVATRLRGGGLCDLAERALKHVGAEGPCFSYGGPALAAPVVTLTCEGDRWRAQGG